MSIHSLRQGAGRALLALSMGLGLAALHTGCTKNDSSYTDPSPAISNFQVATANAFPGDPLTNVQIPAGGTAWFRANFGGRMAPPWSTPGTFR
ncbi:MAG: hypothetical protein IPI84_03490 [Holophagaceae bacterium]|nr:hypothetical protein [Holophagaceae bacterium]